MSSLSWYCGAAYVGSSAGVLGRPFLPVLKAVPERRYPATSLGCVTTQRSEDAMCTAMEAWSIAKIDTYYAREISALLGYYAAPNGNPSPTFRDNVSVPSSRVKNAKNKSFNDVSGRRIGPIFKGQEVHPASLDFLTLEDGTDTLSRNVGKCLPFGAA
jgi:hypothetical protein